MLKTEFLTKMFGTALLQIAAIIAELLRLPKRSQNGSGNKIGRAINLNQGKQSMLSAHSLGMETS